MTKYVTRAMSILVAPENEPIFSELATTVAIDDEAGGEFVVVSQTRDVGLMSVTINPEEWPVLRKAIDRMIGECRKADA